MAAHEQTRSWDYVTAPPRGAPGVTSMVGYRTSEAPGEVHRGTPSSTLTFIVTLDDGVEAAETADALSLARPNPMVLGGLHVKAAQVRERRGQAGVQLAVHPLASRALFGVPTAELSVTGSRPHTSAAASCRDHRSLPPGTFHPGQSSRLRAPELIEIDGDHETLVTAPKRLADALLEALDALDRNAARPAPGGAPLTATTLCLVVVSSQGRPVHAEFSWLSIWVRLLRRLHRDPGNGLGNQSVRRTPMNTPRIVARSEWLAARTQLLEQEKDLTRRRDRLAAARRELPMVEIDKRYQLDGPNGTIDLRDLFGKHRQLIVYHFMFEPDWDEGCPSCSYFADNFTGAILHLPARDTAFAVVSRAPLVKLTAFKQRMGWTFPWYSSYRSDFNADFGVTVDASAPDSTYNYRSTAEQKAAGAIWIERGELPGLSVFLRDGDRIFHTYSTYARGLDQLINTYNYLDLTPLGRGADDAVPYAMAWLRYHDKYDAAEGHQSSQH